jgi:fibronectin-binding autotransporter adhesin
VTIGSGTMIMKSSDLVNASAGNPGINNNAVLVFDWSPAPGIVTTPDTIRGNITGSGTVRVTNGVVTFAGASSFSGPWILGGGEIVAGSVENVGISGPLGQGGTISFNGGTLGWNVANAYDYSSRFDTSAGQQYSFDTGGSSPTLATGLSSSGGTLAKTGGGTLTLTGASTYTGLTTVSGGQLLFQGPKVGTADIVVVDSADLGIVENGSQTTPNTLTLGSSTGVTLEFNNVTNHTMATLFPNNLIANAPVTIVVNSGRFLAIGDSFPLLKWSTGTAPAVSLGLLAGAAGHLVTNVNNVEIDLVIDTVPFIWTGNQDAFWNTTSIDWLYNGNAVAWADGNYALLDDSSSVTNLTLVGGVQPANATINVSAESYALTNSAGNKLTGPGSLTKNGNGTLMLPGGANDYTGVTTLGGGVLAVSALGNGSAPSDIGAANSANTNIVLNGGTLQYTGLGISIDRLFSVGANGGTIDNEGASALVLNNSGLLGMSGNGPRSLTLDGPNVGDTLACAISNHPAGTALVKNGAGTWILTGTNTYAGGTTVNGGILQVGATGGGPSGTLGSGNIQLASGTTIDFQRTGSLTVPGAISGAGSVALDASGTVILANNNTFSGGTTINAGTLQLGTGGASGSLYLAGNIANYGTLIFNTSGTFYYGAGVNGVISGTGNVIVQGGGNIKAVGNNTYTGWTRIDANTTFTPFEGQDGGLASPVVTNNGTLRLIRQDSTVIYSGRIVGTGKLQIWANNFNPGTITLTGTNTYTGGTFIGGNTLILGDAASAGAGAIPTNSSIVFTNNFTIATDNPRAIQFNRPVGDDFTFSGNITTNFPSPQVNLGIVQLQGGAKVTLTGTNTYGSGTLVNAGQLLIGNGGGSGSVGYGPVQLNSGAPLVINRAGSLSIPGAITGTGGVTLANSATVTLSSAANNYTGPTIVSNGTLIVTSLGGGLELDGGTVIVNGTTSVSNLTVTGNMTINSGTVVATLNKLLIPSNTTYTVSGTISCNGGTLEVLTTGLALTPGDKFFIFSGPVVNGAAMPIISPGCTLQNNLAADGSVTVLTAQPLPALGFSVSSRTNFVVSWPLAWMGGVHLQTQVNSTKVGLSNNWVNVSGIDTVNSFTNVMNLSPSGATNSGCEFYRLTIP